MSAEGLPETAAPGDPSPPPGPVVLGRYDQPPGYGVNRPRGARSWLFTWTTSGQGWLRQGVAELRAGVGDLVVLAPGVRQAYAVAPGAAHWQFWWVHCRPRPTWTQWLRPYTVADGIHAVTPVPAGLHDRIEDAFRRMSADARLPGTGTPPPDAGTSPDDRVAVARSTAARELALCALEEVVLLAATAARRPAPQPGVDPRVRRAQEVMAADPGAPHTVRSLAGSVALSPSRFAHLFTRQLGQSPMRALREARLWHAARLLEDTDLAVERVAAAAGFTSPFHFSRVFRERHGMPPGAYRALHGGGLPEA